jgi:hypothetical protein
MFTQGELSAQWRRYAEQSHVDDAWAVCGNRA